MEYAERVELAQVAYAAYGEITGGKNFRGEPMPTWEDLGPKTQTAWIMAASAAVNHALTPPQQRKAPDV